MPDALRLNALLSRHPLPGPPHSHFGPCFALLFILNIVLVYTPSSSANSCSLDPLPFFSFLIYSNVILVYTSSSSANSFCPEQAKLDSKTSLRCKDLDLQQPCFFLAAGLTDEEE